MLLELILTLFVLQFCQHESKPIKYNKILNYNQMIPSQAVLKKNKYLKDAPYTQSFLLPSTDSKSGQGKI